MKIFIISSADSETLQTSEMKNVEIVATNENKKLITNSTCFPQNAVKFTFNEMNNRVTIEFQLKSGESLAIGDKD